MNGDELYVGGVFIAGLLSFFAPCVVPLLPLYLSYLSGGTSSVNSQEKISNRIIRIRTVLKTLFFVFGISTIFIVIGFGAGALGSVINSRWFTLICGAIIISMGIHQVGILKIPYLEREKKISISINKNNDMLGAYILGLTFSFGWTPCIGPILGSVLGVSLSEGSTTYGGFLLFIYSLGLSVPFIIVSIFSEQLLLKIKGFNKHLEKIKKVSGIIIILMGIALMTNQVNSLISWFE